MAVKLADAQRMAAAAKKAGVKTLVAFNNIKTPAALVAKQIIDRGEIGELVRFRGRFDQGFFNDPSLPWSWRCSRELAGTGAVGDLGAHAVSVAQFLMGDVTAVSALAQTIFKERSVSDFDAGYGSKVATDAKKRAVENEDQIQSLVKFSSGAAGVIEASRICAGRVFGVFWEISGTEGTIANNGERFNELQVFRMSEAKRNRGFTTIYCGSQVPQYSAFFGFAQSATGEVKNEESRILRNLRSAVDRGETAVALCFAHSKDLKLIEPFAVVYQSALGAADFPKNPENAPGTDAGSLDDTRGTGGKFHQRLDLIFVFDRPFFCVSGYLASVARIEFRYWTLFENCLRLRGDCRHIAHKKICDRHC